MIGNVSLISEMCSNIYLHFRWCMSEGAYILIHERHKRSVYLMSEALLDVPDSTEDRRKV